MITSFTDHQFKILQNLRDFDPHFFMGGIVNTLTVEVEGWGVGQQVIWLMQLVISVSYVFGIISQTYNVCG